MASHESARLSEMGRALIVAGVVMLGGCGKSAPSQPPPISGSASVVTSPPRPGPPPPPAAKVPNHARMHATWGAVKTDEQNCWYFSGPTGRDTKLAGDVVFDRDGPQVTMTFGGATFRGTYRDSVLDLERASTHVFDGRWTTKEHIHGDYVGGKVLARYHYEECHVGEPCPNECRIDGALVFGAT